MQKLDIIIIIICIFSPERYAVCRCAFTDNKLIRISYTLIAILVNTNFAVVWIVSNLHRISYIF